MIRFVVQRRMRLRAIHYKENALVIQKYQIRKSSHQLKWGNFEFSIVSIDIGLKDFEFLEILGVGAYGAVWKVKKIKTNDVYALKVIDTK
jgi:serine/threonine protein kinase